jgi:hypothetical protein
MLEWNIEQTMRCDGNNCNHTIDGSSWSLDGIASPPGNVIGAPALFLTDLNRESMQKQDQDLAACGKSPS